MFDSMFDGENAIRLYFNDITESIPLSRERDVELSKRINDGDMEARNELVQANLRFVIEVAKNYQNRGLSFPDLISAGNLGLLTAAERFDDTRRFKFIRTLSGEFVNRFYRPSPIKPALSGSPSTSLVNSARYLRPRDDSVRDAKGENPMPMKSPMTWTCRCTTSSTPCSARARSAHWTPPSEVRMRAQPSRHHRRLCAGTTRQPARRRIRPRAN